MARSSLLRFRFIASLSLSLLVAACSGEAGSEGKQPLRPEVPANAIPIGDDVYMVPLAEPVGGCPAFGAFSPTRPVFSAVYFRTGADYRAEEGPFTLDRHKADCG